MSKQVTAQELAEVITFLLTQKDVKNSLDDAQKAAFMTEVAELACKYAGGEVRNPATDWVIKDYWLIGIHGNEQMADFKGGVWAPYDQEGEFFDTVAEEERWLETRFGTEHPDFTKTEWQIDVVRGDTKLSYWRWVAHNLLTADTEG